MRKAFKKSVSTKAIRKLLKDYLWFSFRRGSPKDIRAKDQNLLYLQAILSWRIIDWIGEGLLLANIDGVWYTKSVRTNYLWLPIGKNVNIINSNWWGRAVMIFAIFLNDEWVAAISNQTTNSIKFWRFLVILEYFIKLWLYQLIENTRVTMDNAVIHWCKKSEATIERLKLKFQLLPPYSPNLAPAELVFTTSKRILGLKMGSTAIDFGKNRGKFSIIKSLSAVDPLCCRKIWNRVWKEYLSAMIRVLKNYLQSNLGRRWNWIQIMWR